MRSYLEARFNFRTAITRVRRISQKLAYRDVLEAPMGVFTGKTRTRMAELAQKTGNPDFFMAYLHTGLSSKKRSLFEESDELPQEFVKQVEKSLASIRTLDPSGRIAKPTKLDEAAIASLVENAFMAAQDIVQGLKIVGGHPPCGMEDCRWRLTTRSTAKT